MNILILLFFGWSVTSIIVNGTIFMPLRNYLLVMYPFFGKLFSCIQCLGLWTGAFIFIPVFLIDKVEFTIFNDYTNFIIFPFIQSGFGVIVESFIIWLVKGSNNK